MASVRQYYCYNCMNQTQADTTTFTCRRCGGGFIQEMPDDPFPPPRDSVQFNNAGDPSGRRFSASSGNRGAEGGPQGDFLRPSGIRLQFPQQQGGNPPQGFRPNMMPHGMQARAPPVPGHMHMHRPVIQGQVTITQHLPEGMPGLVNQPYAAPRSMSFPMGAPRPMPQQMPPNQMQFMPGQPMMFPVAPQQWQAQARMMGVPFSEMGPGVPLPPHPMMPPPPVGIPLQMPLLRPPNMAPQGQPPMVPPGQEGQGQGQQEGVLLVGVTDENGQPNIQNVFQLFGGTVNNIMENLEEAVTALLNQIAQQGGPPPITQEDVDRIPVNPVTKEMVGENKSCSICLENFNVSEPFKELACTHQFHGSCIDRWLLIHGNCPICRAHFGPENNNENNQEGQWFQQQFGNIVVGNGGGQMQAQMQAMPPFNFQQRMPATHHIHIRPAQQPMPRGPNLWMGAPPGFVPQQQQQNTAFAFQPVQSQNMGPRGNMGGPGAMQQQQFFAHQQPAGHLQMVNLGGSSPNQAPNANDAVVWSGQVYLNDPAGPTIVLDLHRHPQQLRQARPAAPRPSSQQRPQASSMQQRPSDQQQQGPRMAAPQHAAQNQPTQGIPAFLQSLVNQVTQAFVRPPQPSANTTNEPTTSAANASGASAQTGVSDMSEATYSSADGSSASPPDNPPSRSLQDDLDFD